MGQITSFRVSGLAGRTRTLALELNSGVNVFWGLNGSGKTSLLKILHSALVGRAAPLAVVPYKEAEVGIRSGKSEFSRHTAKPSSVGKTTTATARRRIQEQLRHAMFDDERSDLLVSDARFQQMMLLREDEI